MKAAIRGLATALDEKGGSLYLSDLFRSYDMQMQAHVDYASGKKRAFSPSPGGSLHEAGRAFDLDLKATVVSLANLWELARAVGLVPIIDTPDPAASEAWHFECRGSHQLVYEHYRAGKGRNFSSPYKALAASAIVAAGVRVDAFEDGQEAAYLQSALIRLGQDVGNIDGRIGPKSRAGLSTLGLGGSDLVQARTGIDVLLQQRFSTEFFDAAADELVAMTPEHEFAVVG